MGRDGAETPASMRAGRRRAAVWETDPCAAAPWWSARTRSGGGVRRPRPRRPGPRSTTRQTPAATASASAPRSVKPERPRFTILTASHSPPEQHTYRASTWQGRTAVPASGVRRARHEEHRGSRRQPPSAKPRTQPSPNAPPWVSAARETAPASVAARALRGRRRERLRQRLASPGRGGEGKNSPLPQPPSPLARCAARNWRQQRRRRSARPRVHAANSSRRYLR